MNSKVIKIVAIIFGVLVLGMVVYLLVPKSTLLLSVAPEEFTVMIDGKDPRSEMTGNSIMVAPGPHKVTISRDEFDTYEETITFKNNETFELLYALNPQTEAARKLLESEKSQQIIQRITGKKMNEGVDKLKKDYPIVTVLPIEDKFFTISSCASEEYPNDSTKIAICVNLYDLEAKASVNELVKSKGFDLDNYETHYIDSSNGEEDSHDHREE